MDLSAHTHQLSILRERASDTPAGGYFDRVLYAIMWLCSIVLVAVMAYVKLRAALMDGLPINWVALVIRLALLGCMCWVVLSPKNWPK